MTRPVPIRGLQRSSPRFIEAGFAETVLEKIRNPIILIDDDACVRYLNPAAERAIGFSRHELIQRRPPYPWCAELASPQSVASLIGRSFETAFSVETQLRRRDGISFSVEMACMPIVTGYYALTWTDIDLRKRSEKNFEESERLYRALCENITDVIWVTDWDLNYKYISPSIKLLTGYTPEETARKRLDEILTPSSAATAKLGFMEAITLERQGYPQLPVALTQELELRRRDGTTVWTEFKCVFLRDDSGQAVGTLGVSRDISERKRAQSELAALHRVSLAITQSLRLDVVLDEMVVQVGAALGADCTRIVIVNPDGSLGPSSEHSVIGLKSFSSLESQACEATIASTGKPRIIASIEASEVATPALLAAGIRSYAGMPVKGNGGLIGVLSVYSRSQDAFGRRAGFLEAFASEAAIAIENARLYETARSERLRAQQLLGQLLVAQENERQRLSLDLHDTVIQSIYGILAHVGVAQQLLSRENPAETQSELDCAKTALEQSLIDLRRVITGLHPPALDKLGLAQALRQYVNESTGNDSRVRCIFRTEGMARRLTPSLELGVYRIAQEAISNAWRHASASEIAVDLRFSSNAIQLEVTDNGRGFELSNWISGKPASGHFGFHNMKERADLLGGTLQVETRPNAGTKVKANIPTSIG